MLLLRFISFLASILIIFICLLVCYNPRDEIEVELLKTGVMTDEDIETIRRLKSEHKFSYQQGKIYVAILIWIELLVWQTTTNERIFRPGVFITILTPFTIFIFQQNIKVNVNLSIWIVSMMLVLGRQERLLLIRAQGHLEEDLVEFIQVSFDVSMQ